MDQKPNSAEPVNPRRYPGFIQGRRGMGFQPVFPQHGQDAHATNTAHE
jgi:hypothetical protein